MANNDQGTHINPAAHLADQLLRVGIDGMGSFKSAEEIADQAMQRFGDKKAATDWILSNHTRMAAVEGFVTGVGGFITLVVSIPANIAGFYLLATRMVAAIARINGHDLDDQAVRKAILLCLGGEDSGKILSTLGMATTSGRILGGIAQGVSPALQMAVNKAVTFRVLTSIGKSALGSLGRGVPVAGGVVGAAMDGILIRRIGSAAREEFDLEPEAPVA
jgi:EcsC protein family